MAWAVAAPPPDLYEQRRRSCVRNYPLLNLKVDLLNFSEVRERPVERSRVADD